MKRVFILFFVFIVLISWIGCGQKDTGEADKVPADVKEAEMMDSTRFDSTADTVAVEEVETPVDSL